MKPHVASPVFRAISLHQPYASLVAQRLKRHETRSRSTNARGWVAIHAAKTWGPKQREDLARIERELAIEIARPLPFGGIVAVAWLERVRLITDGAPDQDEAVVGDWRRGRYAWNFTDVCPLDVLVPIDGHQWIWTLTPRQVRAVAKQCGLHA